MSKDITFDDIKEYLIEEIKEHVSFPGEWIFGDGIISLSLHENIDASKYRGVKLNSSKHPAIPVVMIADEKTFEAKFIAVKPYYDRAVEKYKEKLRVEREKHKIIDFRKWFKRKK